VPAPDRAAARRAAETLIERTGGVLVRGVRALAGRGSRHAHGAGPRPTVPAHGSGPHATVPEAVVAAAVQPAAATAAADAAGAVEPPEQPREPAAGEAAPSPAAEVQPNPAGGEDAAARIDAARARLRARIARPPGDDDPSPPPAE